MSFHLFQPCPRCGGGMHISHPADGNLAAVWHCKHCHKNKLDDGLWLDALLERIRSARAEEQSS